MKVALIETMYIQEQTDYDLLIANYKGSASELEADLRRQFPKAAIGVWALAGDTIKIQFNYGYRNNIIAALHLGQESYV